MTKKSKYNNLVKRYLETEQIIYRHLKKVTLEKKYNVLYVDPPWSYSFSKSKSRNISNQYPTMNIDDICNLKVPAAENAVLYLWTTAPKVEEALKVINAWRFDYKSQMIWDKERMGMGYWSRVQHEILMIATRGRISPPRPEDRIPSVTRIKREFKHSKKPSFYREYLVNCFPRAKRLEMFARHKYKKWDVWGNEVECDVLL